MAVFRILKVLYKFDVQSLYIFVKLFDSKVQSVLLYPSEIWGLDGDCNQIEKRKCLPLNDFLVLDNELLIT